MKKRTTTGFAYAGFDNKKRTRLKLGSTDDLKKRLRQHRTSNPTFAYYRTFETPHYKDAERFLKYFMTDFLVPGAHEWYDGVGLDKIDEAFLELDKFLLHHLSPQQEEQFLLFKQQKANGKWLKADAAITVAVERLRKLRHEKNRVDFHYNQLLSVVGHYIGPNEGIVGLCTWKHQSKTDVDRNRLKTLYPEIWDACLREQISRRLSFLGEEGTDSEDDDN